MSYCRKRYKAGLCILLPCIAYNLYFILLLPGIKLFFLLYLDGLLCLVMAVCFVADYQKESRREREKRALLKVDSLISQEFEDREDADIVEHDIKILEKQIQDGFAMNCELQDYMAGWCHEIKVPLSAALLMSEKIEEADVKEVMQEQLEKMNLQLNSVLLGAKLQSSLFDLQIGEVNLFQCVKKSIHNNQFFLVKKHFTLKISENMKNTGGADTGYVVDGTEAEASETDCAMGIRVYTDPAWLVYVLDQLISNAVKYAGDEPVLKIYAKMQNETIRLYVEDNGEGIKESDIRRIFEKGYTGSNYHNGQYKSTGMGLYMTALILEKLGHDITVESEYGKGSRFIITFSDNREYFFQ
ncbi:MAG: sensor histidine kinase [Roseburia sp.]|nr:sensor histidine kinase [Roseburia sp.]MCM1243558.1 sensor histidine kinase [Roseburia sp.]